MTTFQGLSISMISFFINFRWKIAIYPLPLYSKELKMVINSKAYKNSSLTKIKIKSLNLGENPPLKECQIVSLKKSDSVMTSWFKIPYKLQSHSHLNNLNKKSKKMPQFIITFRRSKKFHVKSIDKHSYPNLPPTGLTRQRFIKFKKEKWKSSFPAHKTKNQNFMSNIETSW